MEGGREGGREGKQEREDIHVYQQYVWYRKTFTNSIMFLSFIKVSGAMLST